MEVNRMTIINPILFIIAIIGYCFAGYYTIRLAQETKGEKYWYFFAISALALVLHQLVDLLGDFGIVTFLSNKISGLILHIIAGLSMGYASYGIVRTMIKIRKKIE